MGKTIEERYKCNHKGCSNECPLYHTDAKMCLQHWAIKFAAEQKAIDDKRYEEYLAYMNRELTNDLSFQRKTIIDKACEWITNHNGDDSVIEEFLKYMEG